MQALFSTVTLIATLAVKKCTPAGPQLHLDRTPAGSHHPRSAITRVIQRVGLQVLVVAKQVIRTLVNVKTEKIDVLLPTEKEVWTLPVSIFKPRSLRGPDQADSRDFTDTPEVIDKMFETDWQRLVSKVRTVLSVPSMQKLLITGRRCACS